jgi:hypothetical protein
MGFTCTINVNTHNLSANDNKKCNVKYISLQTLIICNGRHQYHTYDANEKNKYQAHKKRVLELVLDAKDCNPATMASGV